jgi:NitT/TauT family transport system substrate-binding protein
VYLPDGTNTPKKGSEDMDVKKSSISRRGLLAGAGIGAVTLAMPNIAFGQARPFRILLASNSPTIYWSPSYVAEAMGYYKEEGLEIERIPNNSGAVALTALVSRSGEALHSVPGEFLVAVSRGQKLKILSALSNYSPYYFIVSKAYADKLGLTEATPLDQRLAAVKKFKGIRVGITSPNSGTDVTVRALFRDAGISPDTDAQLIPLGSTINSLAAMSTGAVDAFVASPPIPEMAHAQQGAIRLFSVGKDNFAGLKAAAGHGMIVRSADVETNPDLYAAAVRADTKGMRKIVEDPKGSGDVLYKLLFSKTMTPEIWQDVWENNRDQFRTPYVTEESVEDWITMGLVTNLTDPKTVNLAEDVDMRFVDKAVKDIGWDIKM